MGDPAPQTVRPRRRWPRTGSDEELGPLKILVCDDEKPIVRLIQVNLEGQGYEVHSAYDGRESLDKVRTVQPDICILDVMMPFMDGYDVLRKIRRDPETETIYVIMLTTAVSDEDRAKGYELGADLYLTKPFNPGEMARMIDHL